VYSLKSERCCAKDAVCKVGGEEGVFSFERSC
jgi:hypothetical protein